MKKPARGFTLVELLVVVAVLAATALAAFGLMTEDRAQVRMDDTRTRLTILRQAIIGLETPAYGGAMRLSGFVADNGKLPSSLDELLTLPSVPSDDASPPTKAYAALADVMAASARPKLANTLNDKCYPDPPANGDELPEDTPSLLKGHRGQYLAGAAQNGAFRDGWGNHGKDDNPPTDNDADKLHFGWQVRFNGDDAAKNDLPDDNLERMTITSLGADNLKGQSSDLNLAAEADISMEIRPEDWQVNLAGWRITLTNRSGVDISSPETPGVTLLVFENTLEGGRWRQFRSKTNSCEEFDLLINEQSCAFEFTGKTDCGDAKSIDARVPLGRHLAILTLDGKLPTNSSLRRMTTADFYPGTLQPELHWEIR
ncbi:MAG: prepilin-type N-terminal cleavage/methylation domain-containing protein [Zoogloeaceae bacterium]|jgi:prepilin-type N-terminal cleavage/methylation domain-containing protein|nr:prepilin-type N-terminal cleavage/methylation domain-containing protein [Zoogloeaceae bacterium]